jgi:hypothetical protein
METAAVSDETTRPTPLAALALVVAIPAPLILAFLAYSASPWLGPVVFVAAVGVVLLIGRGSIGVPQTLGVTIATSWMLAVFSIVVFYVGIFVAMGGCNGGTSPRLHISAVVLAALVYAVLGFWSLRRGWWWGPAFALVLALVLGVILTFALPGVPHPEPCSSD